MTVNAGVNFAAVDELAQVLQRMNFAFFEVLGIDDALPVLIEKPRHTDKIFISKSIAYSNFPK
jgi:hypothetical protein